MISDSELSIVSVPHDAQSPFSTMSVILSRSNLSTVKHSTSEVRSHIARKTPAEAIIEHYNAHPEQNWAKKINAGADIEQSMRKVIAKYTNPLYDGMESTLNLLSSAYNLRIYLLSCDNESDVKVFGSEDTQFFCIMKTNNEGYIDAVVPLPESGIDPIFSKTTVPSGIFKLLYPKASQTSTMEMQTEYPIEPPTSKLLNHNRWMECAVKSIMTIDDRGAKYDAIDTIQQSYTFETNRRDVQVNVTIQNTEPPSRVYHYFSSHRDPVFDETFTTEVTFSTPAELAQQLQTELKNDIVLDVTVYVKNRDLLLIDPRSVLFIDA